MLSFALLICLAADPAAQVPAAHAAFFERQEAYRLEVDKSLREQIRDYRGRRPDRYREAQQALKELPKRTDLLPRMPQPLATGGIGELRPSSIRMERVLPDGRVLVTYRELIPRVTVRGGVPFQGASDYKDLLVVAVGFDTKSWATGEWPENLTGPVIVLDPVTVRIPNPLTGRDDERQLYVMSPLAWDTLTADRAAWDAANKAKPKGKPTR